MHTNFSDLIAAVPLIAGTISGFLFAVLGFNWTLTAVTGFLVSLIAMAVVGLIIRRRQESETVITVNRFILK